MCGIFVSYNMLKRVAYTVMQSLAIRGRDGWGLYAGEQIIRKPESIDSGLPEFINRKLILANSRAIPTTEVQTGAGKGIENQQPFFNERYAVVHNGILSNDKELIAEYNLKPSSKVDTAILPELFSKVGVVEGLKLLKGSFAIFCHDKEKDKLYIAKNFMPLQFYKFKHQFMCVSLKEMIPDYLKEHSREVEPYTCYEIDLNTKKEIELIKHNLYPKERNKKVLVICSGGIDSVTTAYLYKYMGYEVKLLHFTYGQAAQDVEFYAVQKIADDLKAELIVYDAQPVFKGFKSISRLLNHTGSNKDTQMLDAESTFSYVPNRNAIFAMIGGAIAETKDCDTLTFGGQQMDSVYPDNNNTFVDAVDSLLKYSLNWNTNVKFTSPLINLIKHEIVEMGMKIGVPYEYVCSCYYPKLKNHKIVPCGKCGCCQFRHYAFKMLQVVDVQFDDEEVCKEDYSKITDVKEFVVKYVEPYS